MSDKRKENYQVGALLRRNFRALLDQADIQYTEHKGLLDSVFTVNAYPAQHGAIHGMIKEMSR